MIREGFTEEENSIIDNFKQEGYTEEESIIIVKLEQYAHILTNIIHEDVVDMDYDVFYNYLDNLPKNIDKRILDYSDYLRGASMPLYEESKNKRIKHSYDISDSGVGKVSIQVVPDYDLVNNYDQTIIHAIQQNSIIEDLLESKDWCELEENIKNKNINTIKLKSELNFGLDNSKYSLSFLIGYYHCICIKKNHESLKKYRT
jgi:hypothetical protein